MLINEECEHSGGPLTPERLRLKTAHYCLEGFLLIQMESVTPLEWFIKGQMFTSEFCACYDGFGPADSSPGSWCRSPGNSKKNKKLNLNVKLLSPEVLKNDSLAARTCRWDFFLIPVSRHHAGSCGILPSLYTKALLSQAAFKGELCCESNTAAVTLLCRADARPLNLSDSSTNPLQSLKSLPSNTVWQGSTQS